MMAAVDSFQLLYREIARSCSCYVETLALVGACYTVSKAVVFMRDCYSLIRLHFIPRLVCHRDLSQQYGHWAVICGASEAISKAYAEELARNGICVILISSDIRNVADTAKAITETYGVEAILIEADFSQGPSACKPIKDAICGKDVGFIINSLDGSLDLSQDFIDLSEAGVWDIMNRNIVAATLVSHMALPTMVERGKGAVVNISMGGCSRPTARKAALSASTAFLDNFSRALHYEYGHRGIFVQCLLPFRVAPQRPEGSIAAGWLVPSPQVYASHALSTLGVSHRTTGYWPHTIQFRLVQCMPEWVWMLGSRLFTQAI
ncbi:inactive hydroxysteroid dehydrogenase-like protein 1 isoform X2 [Myxocyprinus asiaticus]|uniref:inactive hydroxysteroid dehydrogenase-like protein 1 isoform X2 n=1 Tax=Myxocyprinus asiaticus TaxID=70543 RepID=UPI002222A536|nr:inactive hydroxysteroid dehydrogenase-like protein 1 isoform X2 [Myxocyprinus asiaticus]